MPRGPCRKHSALLRVVSWVDVFSILVLTVVDLTRYLSGFSTSALRVGLIALCCGGPSYVVSYLGCLAASLSSTH